MFSIRSPLRLLSIWICFLAAGNVAFAGEAQTTAPAGALELAVGGLASDRGKVLVALFASEESYDGPSEPARKKMLTISDQSAQILFSNLPPGDYALRVFHDENDNGELDTNWAGIPKEAFGFSNGAMGRFGPPSFDAAKFRIDSAVVRMTIQLQQF